MLGLFNLLQAQPVHEQLYVETGDYAGHFSKKPRPSVKIGPERSAHPRGKFGRPGFYPLVYRHTRLRIF